MVGGGGLQLVLSPTGLPGQCLALEGAVGHVDIRLRAPITVTAVTLEHVPRCAPHPPGGRWPQSEPPCSLC